MVSFTLTQTDRHSFFLPSSRTATAPDMQMRAQQAALLGNLATAAFSFLFSN